ncbi:MAG: addiction module component CHP02574 family protein [Sphingobacteriaceae bacterium]|nr:MAG: addiction module component CHP02574 family protein [Sphingobacteriaceae bacterium]
MELNYVSDNAGNTVAVQISIEEWNLLKEKYPDVENLHSELPQWQKELIDTRLKLISENPMRLLPIEELFEELDNDK